jgi:hypothetical protein
VNAWFERLRAAVAAEIGEGSEAALDLTREDAQALLDLARDAAHGSGARQYAPLATYLAGRLIEARSVGNDQAARTLLIAALARAAEAAGPAGGDAI